jgi:hypothetical protein
MPVVAMTMSGGPVDQGLGVPVQLIVALQSCRVACVIDGHAAKPLLPKAAVGHPP